MCSPKQRHRDFKDNKAYTSLTWSRESSTCNRITAATELAEITKRKTQFSSKAEYSKKDSKQTNRMRQAKSVPPNKRKERCLQKGCPWHLLKRATSVFPSWKQVLQSGAQETWNYKQFLKPIKRTDWTLSFLRHLLIVQTKSSLTCQQFLRPHYILISADHRHYLPELKYLKFSNDRRSTYTIQEGKKS